LTELGKQKGNMRRKAHNKLWTLILSLLLCGASLAPPSARVACADTSPTDPVPGVPGPGPGAGDPDSPDTGKSLPTPVSHRGFTGQSARVAAPQGSLGIWLLRLRMAFASVYHFLYRF
jgi:hypothetical protein